MRLSKYSVGSGGMVFNRPSPKGASFAKNKHCYSCRTPEVCRDLAPIPPILRVPAGLMYAPHGMGRTWHYGMGLPLRRAVCSPRH